MARRRRSGADRGAAAVEMALVLPLLLLLVFGIIDFGRMLNAQIRLTEAAREGARAQVIGESPQPRVQAVTTGMTGVGWAFVGNASGPRNCTGKNAEDDAEVKVTYLFKFATPVGILAGFLPGGSGNGELSMQATGVMPCRA